MKIKIKGVASYRLAYERGTGRLSEASVPEGRGVSLGLS